MFTESATHLPPSPVQRCIVVVLLAYGGFAVAHGIVALGLPLGPDFTNLMGRMAAGDSVTTLATARIAVRAAPALAWDWETLQATVREIAPSVPGEAAWPYPPTALVLTAALGFLEPVASLGAWLIAIVAAGAAAAALAAGRTEAAVVGAASPATAATVITGQFTTFGALALAAFVRFFDRDPRLAGLALGLAAIKPQLVVAAGILALIERRWRLLAWAIGAQLALVAASTALLGPEVWPAFLAAGRRQTEYLLAGRVAPARTVSVFQQLIVLGTPRMVAALVAVPAAIVAILACRAVFRCSDDPVLRLIVLAAATILTVPYAHDYDFALLLAPGALLMLEAWRCRLPPGRLVLAGLVFVLPMPALLIGLTGHQQVGAPIAAVLLAAAFLAATRREAAPSPSPSAG